MKLTPLEACDYSTSLLKKAGFQFIRTSLKSTSCYYGLPGRIGTIRVSLHTRKKDKKDRHNSGPVVSSIVFSPAQADSKGLIKFPQSVEFMIASAIGLYMIRAEHENHS